MKVLMLNANPKNSGHLDLPREARTIERELDTRHLSKEVVLMTRWAVTAPDLQKSLLAEKPQVVHFSGHGVSGDQANGGDRSLYVKEPAALVLEDDNGQAHKVTSEALGSLFKLFQGKIECVILNACYSEQQASVINQYIPYVIGMSVEISDPAAIQFARGFYMALAQGESFESAYQHGCVALGLGTADIKDEKDTPVFKKNEALLKQSEKVMSVINNRHELPEFVQIRIDGLLVQQTRIVELMNEIESRLLYENALRVEEVIMMNKQLEECKTKLLGVEKELAELLPD